MLGQEDLLGVLFENLLLDERKVRKDHLAHVLLYLRNLLVRREIDRMLAVISDPAFLDLAVETGRKGMVDNEHLVRIHVRDDFLEYEAERAEVAAATVRVIVADEFYFHGLVHLVGQLLELLVRQRCKHRHIFFCLRIQLPCNFSQSSSCAD